MAFRCQVCSVPVQPEWAEGAILTCGHCQVAQPSPFFASALPGAAGEVGARVVTHGSLVFSHAQPGAGVPVVLVSCGKMKISCIKAIREITGWGLRDAKEAADRCPSLLGHAQDAREASRWIHHLAETGASARVG